VADTLNQGKLDKVQILLHRVEHLWAIKGQHGRREGVLIVDCWRVPMNTIPEWAIEAQERGDPPRDWCPWINPSLIADEPGILDPRPLYFEPED
jgi:hypothetical protein